MVAFRDGGATAVGIVALIRMLPSALIAPFATAVADRVRRDRVLIWIGVLRAAAMGAAAVVMAVDLSAVFVYLLAVIATIPFTAFRPAHSALLPALCETPTELTAANASRGCSTPQARWSARCSRRCCSTSAVPRRSSCSSRGCRFGRPSW